MNPSKFKKSNVSKTLDFSRTLQSSRNRKVQAEMSIATQHSRKAKELDQETNHAIN
ncbi:unnamed protein product [Trifolium pratense]|uniref:Uncharacterized protein n=1 Tax=Trifolium pratense TaxID=57577 RepID=A0ACB0KTN0_TRIPR|nr:unnamed protein product [Trifolium pratense]